MARRQKKEKWVAVSGGFDPLHVGHVRMFEAARSLGDRLVVILNNDNWLRNKKGYSFMSEKERYELLLSIVHVDKVVITDHAPDDTDRSVVRMLKKIKPAVFANGGDRDVKDAQNAASSLSAEHAFCIEHGIEMAFGVGRGGKIQSSSWLIDAAAQAKRAAKASGVRRRA